MIQLSGNKAPYSARNGNRALFQFSTASLIAAAALLSSCTTPDGNSVDPLNSVPAAIKPEPVTLTDKAMFDDLSGIAAQVFPPLSTTLQVNRDNTDPRMQYFVSGLADKGFGIQRVSADQGSHYLAYTLKDTDTANEKHLSIAIGAVLIGRDYRQLQGNAVSPHSVVRLSGTRTPVVVADSPSRRFKIEDPAFSEARYVASLGLDEASPVIALITPDIVSKVSEQASDGPSLQGLNSSKVEVNNLFYGNESTFASILENYQRIDRQIIVFGNDSMILGDTNKQLIEQFVDGKMKDTDVISLVGCSNGPTSLDIGNEGLALGRAQRVTQALLARGVAREKVLDEGCWAPTNVGDRFPSRGVVIELWRSNA